MPSVCWFGDPRATRTRKSECLAIHARQSEPKPPFEVLFENVEDNGMVPAQPLLDFEASDRTQMNGSDITRPRAPMDAFTQLFGGVEQCE